MGRRDRHSHQHNNSLYSTAAAPSRYVHRQQTAIQLIINGTLPAWPRLTHLPVQYWKYLIPRMKVANKSGMNYQMAKEKNIAGSRNMDQETGSKGFFYQCVQFLFPAWFYYFSVACSAPCVPLIFLSMFFFISSRVNKVETSHLYSFPFKTLGSCQKFRVGQVSRTVIFLFIGPYGSLNTTGL